MQPIEELQDAVRRAREALSRVEHTPAAQAIEAYARARALLFARLLLAQVGARVAQSVPSTAAELTALLEAALAQAAGQYLVEGLTG